MRTQNQEGPQVSQTFWREGGKNNTLIGALQYEASTARTNRWTKSTAAEHKTRCGHRQTALGRAKLHIASKLQTTIAHTNHSQGDPQSPKSAAFTFSSSCTRYDFSLAVPGCSRVLPPPATIGALPLPQTSAWRLATLLLLVFVGRQRSSPRWRFRAWRCVTSTAAPESPPGQTIPPTPPTHSTAHHSMRSFNPVFYVKRTRCCTSKYTRKYYELARFRCTRYTA